MILLLTTDLGAVHRVLFVPPKLHKKPGPATSLSDRELRLLVRTAAKGQLSDKQLQQELTLSTSVRTIQRVLSGVDWLIYSKMDNTLPLSAKDKRAREVWAWDMVLNKDPFRSWETIIFSDEKKWNLDGPDGFQNYWRDVRHPPRQTKRRQAGGGSVIVWAGFSATGKTKLAVLVGKQNSDDYIHTVSEFLLPFAHLHYGTDSTYQQDGASIHRSKVSMEFF
ncbi:Transposable element Tc3 transposase [Phytophthora citrophthora]|uniref:Transposable element Tc3 transposase n=1 Tax=Phytophthora citrophthora TaxID=4793 RepID=A0AAD9LD16_9STRA|nr:Transposable element Tc3 transposase [Phytophthora citrophthora]